MKFNPEPIVVHHGDATGVDRSFKRAALFCGVKHREFKADWTVHGKKAGPIRNEAMVAEQPDLCLAFHERLEFGGGTYSCARLALAAGIPTYHVRNETCQPLRLKVLRYGLLEYDNELPWHEDYQTDGNR